MTSRIDAVFIRKSTKEQDEKGQMQNVENMLKELSVYVPERYWFVCTVPRPQVQGNSHFNRLKELIEADKVGTVYVESQDRWGTADVSELFTLLGILSNHGTRLFDLREKIDLTCKDDSTQIRAFLGGLKSKKEREDLSYRSLRSRVNNFKDAGSWPTGAQPYGYGKRCYSAEGKLLWEWQPINRTRGQVFYADDEGNLTPGPDNVKIPRKVRTDKNYLVPSNNPRFVQAVKLVFDLFTRVGLSRRQISARLNAEGHTFNGGPFTHPDVTNILKNPAYKGDTHFGKRLGGGLHTFDEKGIVVKSSGGRTKPGSQGKIAREDTHEPLVDRKTWDMAQKRLAAERERTSFAPRNPDYYLKQIFVCGHCGKGLTGRTETDRKTRKRTVSYVCPTYIMGEKSGYQTPCGYQRITHADAERLLLDKIKELGLPFEEDSSKEARTNLQARLARLGHEDEKSIKQWECWVQEGIDALAAHLIDEHPAAGEWPLIQRLRRLAMNFYLGDLDGEADEGRKLRGLPVSLADLKKAVQEAETLGVGEAQRRIAELRAEHASYTRQWVKATDEMQAVLKRDIERLEEEVRSWEPRTVPLSRRIETLFRAENERREEREKLLAEWPALENREKGEALRRMFKTVTLRWERKFHPARAKPSRPRTTDRPGRWGYTLLRDKIEWSFSASNLESSS